MIPTQITKEHILNAVAEIDRTGVPAGRGFTKYYLLYANKKYPPKYTISLAAKSATGKELNPEEFSGGVESNAFLEHLGFTIGSIWVGSVKTSWSRKDLKKRTAHNERCSECKNTLIQLFGKLYGTVKIDHKIDVPAKLQAFEGRPFYESLKVIHDALVTYRGHASFIRLTNLHRCDLFVSSESFVVEFDESQHFTEARGITLSLYPATLSVGYDKGKYRELCQQIRAKDNSPLDRDEQRAWYDTIRDYLSLIMGFRPTVRIPMAGFQWCTLNPEVSSDVQRFKTLLGFQATLAQKEDAYPLSALPMPQVHPQPQTSVGRIVIRGKWDGKSSSANRILRTVIKEAQGKELQFRYLMTCGGFLRFGWPENFPLVTEPKNPSQIVLNKLIGVAEEQCRSLLSGDVLRGCRSVTRFLTIGVDSQDDNTGHHVELVAVCDLPKNKYYWTGKSYPTASQERDLVRFSDLDSHFVELDGDRVLVLGCHDLNLFSPRAEAVAGPWRSKLIKDFRGLAKLFKPTIVLQHPHSTDSPNVWYLAWKTLEKELQSVDTYASAGLYYCGGSKCRGSLKDVLEKTKRGSIYDFVVKP